MRDAIKLREVVARAILNKIIARNAIITGKNYDPDYYDEFDLCEAYEHADAAISIMIEACAGMAERHYDPKRHDFTKDPYIMTLQVAAAIRALGGDQ